MSDLGIATLVLRYTVVKAQWPVPTMKVSRKVGLGQSVGLGLLFIAGCVGLIMLMSSMAV